MAKLVLTLALHNLGSQKSCGGIRHRINPLVRPLVASPNSSLQNRFLTRSRTVTCTVASRDDLGLQTACAACPSSESQGLSRGGGLLAEDGSAAVRRSSRPIQTTRRVPTCPPPSHSTCRQAHRLLRYSRYSRRRHPPTTHPRCGDAAASPMAQWPPQTCLPTSQRWGCSTCSRRARWRRTRTTCPPRWCST